MSIAAYATGAVELVAVLGALAFGAVRVRAALLSSWSGAPARLAEAVLAIAVPVWVAQILGLVGLLHEGAFVLACVVTGIGAGLLAGRCERSAPAPPDAPRVSVWELAFAVAITALLFAHWGFETQQSLNNAITNFDSRWYHLPFAVEFVQEGSVTGLVFTDPLFLNWFYPQNSELLAAVTSLLTERDTLALFLNLGWLGLTLLAAWCAGRPFGRGPHAVIAVAILLESHTLVVREPGTAKNDVVAAGLLLAALAILLNAGRRAATGADSPEEPGFEDRRAFSGRGLPRGALVIAGVATGLACGTKLTALAPAAALTVAVIALAPAGRRLASVALWGLPLLAGGAFWYLRNLVHAANPLPWITELGPLSLPGPERLQEARPSFSVAHYATDFEVWTEWFGPGLQGAFGVLWPVVVGGAILGMVMALARRDPLLRALGAVALFGVIAYLFTPLSAAGQEGMPVAFEINVRFAIPALLMGLSLLAITFPGRSSIARWAFLAAALVVLAVTNDPFAVLSAPERAAGAGIAFAFVLAPATLMALRRIGLPRPAFAAGLVSLALAVLAAGYLVQRDYLSDRFEHFDSAAQIDSAWRFADRLEDARIGLAGTTAAFYRYGFYGEDLSNTVIYLGREGPRGAFSAIPTCRELREAVNAARLDYLVTAPFLDFDDPDRPIESPEAGWIRTTPASEPVLSEGEVTVWELSGELDPRGCERLDVPTRALPGARR